jgi:hypothetical protein
MVALLKVPTTELRRVNDASAKLVEVAKSLSEIAAQTTDSTVKAGLYDQIEKILDSASVANDAILAVTSGAAGSRE